MALATTIVKVARAEFSISTTIVFFLSITFLQLSSRQTPEKTSPIEGRGCLPIIIPLTLSKSKLRPA